MVYRSTRKSGGTRTGSKTTSSVALICPALANNCPARCEMKNRGIWKSRSVTTSDLMLGSRETGFQQRRLDWADDGAAGRGTAAMRQKNRPKRRMPKNVFSLPNLDPSKPSLLPDLDHSKSSVLQSLGSAASQRTYRFAIDDFISWYCSEPRLAFGRTVVLRYRYYLESRQLAPATINLRLAAVRRLAYEASDNGLLSPDLAAGIRRVKGAKRLGMRLGNWLTPTQGKELLRVPDRDSVKGKRNYALLAMLLGCGLRRSELTRLTVSHLQQRDDHSAIVDLS